MRVGLLKDEVSSFTPGTVVANSIGNRSDEEQDEEKPKWYGHITRQDVCVVEHASGKEQAVTWQEKSR